MDVAQMEEGLRFLLYQQLYQEPDYVLDRTRTEALRIDCSGKIINELLSRLFPLVPKWNKDKREFAELLSRRLRVNPHAIERSLENKLQVKPYDPKTWTQMQFSEDQMFLFIIGQIYEAFYRQNIEVVFSYATKNGLQRSDVLVFLTHKFSLLGNLLYLIQLARYLHKKCPAATKAVNRLIPYLFEKDEANYKKEVVRLAAELN